jgi:hypothetical protein
MKQWQLLVLLLATSSLPLLNLGRLFTLTNHVFHHHGKGDYNNYWFRERAPKQSSAFGYLPPNASFGACLMMKEDNDLLYEWIAYHYLLLPLRFVVIGSDEGNTQDPRQVLSRWHNDTGLQYWVMNSSAFVNRHGPYRRKKQDDKDFHHHQLIYRQRGFITTCAEFLQKKGLRWIAYIDSDEFIVLNKFNQDDDASYHTTHSGNATYKMREVLSNMSGNPTVLDVIHRVGNLVEPIAPCYVMPRLRFGALETVSCPESAQVDETAKNEYNYQAMSTLRYKQHGGKNHFAANKFGKVMIELSHIKNVSVFPKNVHRPFIDQCPIPVVWFHDVLFSVNHYTASWERYSHRLDQRRNCENWMELAYHDRGNSCYQNMHEWFPRFARMFGQSKAKFLLGVDMTKQVKSDETCPPEEGFNFSKRLKRLYNMQ